MEQSRTIQSFDEVKVRSTSSEDTQTYASYPAMEISCMRVIPALRPNAFSIPFVIFSIPGFDCFSGRHTYQLIFKVRTVVFGQTRWCFPRICNSAQHSNWITPQ